MKLKAILRTANRWFYDTSERALDQAYRAALMIKVIEDEHFNGKKISTDSGEYSEIVVSYFEADLKKYLNIIKVRLAEFRTSRSVLSISEAQKLNSRNLDANNYEQYYLLNNSERQEVIIEKLTFIDKILTKYERNKLPEYSAALIPIESNQENSLIKRDNDNQLTSLQESIDLTKSPKKDKKNTNTREGILDKTGIIPRTILGTFGRIQQELDPKAEEDVVQKFRTSKAKTIISIKFLMILIIVPILTQQITKSLLKKVGVVERFRDSTSEPFINYQMEEEAFFELHKFEEELHFKSLIGFAPKLSPEEEEELVKDKAQKLAEEYRQRTSNAIRNIIADAFSLMAFGLVLYNSKREITVLKSFMDELIYGLSDSAKAFVIILFTDMFVGFHSPHGWEIILEGISRHLGIPESRNFIFLFIATFPVILDSVIKYWIFRYLNRVSPSAVATYKNMNE
ncbi:MAG: proton extrusion protein PcxA [Symploca sp. SIO2G7]|nr:proton extrusion protein PcxA [Symploca sp. SIO2G7]